MLLLHLKHFMPNNKEKKFHLINSKVLVDKVVAVEVVVIIQNLREFGV